MAIVQDAVLAIRHVVQEHGDQCTRIGGPANIESIRWFGRLLGWTWPASYIEVLAQHDGVIVQDAIVFRFLESIEVFLLFHSTWHQPTGYWPVASDGCGNYFALALGPQNSAGECPVVFFEMISSEVDPKFTVAPSYADFVCGHMRKQCERVGCSVHIGKGDRLAEKIADPVRPP